jgi:RNA polymerase sigma-70 factor, ECF subfamily
MRRCCGLVWYEVEQGMAWIAERRLRSRFETVVLPHLDAAYALARWLTRNDADAADVVQEASLRAFRYFDSYREGDGKSWLLKIVRRACYDWLERNRPSELVPLEAEADADGSVNSPAAIDADALLQTRSDLRRLDRLIEALAPTLREAIVLRELHELDYRQIAEITGVPIGTVMSRLHRARSVLRREWDGKG